MPIASILITNIIIGISIIGLNLVFPVHDLIEIKSNPLPAIPKEKMDSKNVLWDPLPLEMVVFNPFPKNNILTSLNIASIYDFHKPVLPVVILSNDPLLSLTSLKR